MANELKLEQVITNVMINHIGAEGRHIGEGGCPRIQWYALRNEITKAITAWNTRPAAPVEGLAPVLYMREDGVTITPSHFDSIISPKGNYDPLVTRSQAEIIVVAERIRAEEAERDANEQSNVIISLQADNAALTARLETANALVTCCCGNSVDSHGIGDGHSPVDQYHYAMTKLEEQNAALTARVKRMEETKAVVADDKAMLLDLAAKNGDRVVGLETQLAAAKKALEIMVQEYDKVDLLHDEPPSMTSAVLEARAALEDRP